MGGLEEGKDYSGAMTGRFELIAVLTHKGRTLDSGHYIGWVKQKAADTWVQVHLPLSELPGLPVRLSVQRVFSERAEFVQRLECRDELAVQL